MLLWALRLCVISGTLPLAGESLLECGRVRVAAEGALSACRKLTTHGLQYLMQLDFCQGHAVPRELD